MSVLIEGMEMPTECDKCSFNRFDPYHMIRFCTAKKKRFEHRYIRPKWCPLVEVPTPHGRLIDERTAYDKIAEQEGGYYIDMDGVDIGLQETPTVIEAEGDKWNE